MFASLLKLVTVLATLDTALAQTCGGIRCCQNEPSKPNKDFTGRYIGMEGGSNCAYTDTAIQAHLAKWAAIKATREAVAVTESAAPVTPTRVVVPAAPVSAAPVAFAVASDSPVAPIVAPIPSAVPVGLSFTPPTITTSTTNASYIPCSQAIAALSADGSSCTKDFFANTINSKDLADGMASTVVSCICSSRWNPKTPEMQSANQPTCSPPDGYTKTTISSVFKGCGENPLNVKLVVQGLSLKAQLSSGDSYAPYSTSKAQYLVKSPSLLVLLIAGSVASLLF